MDATEKLRNLVLAPYIIKATALIGKRRKVGGNQFRHAIATMGIIFDYKLFDNYVLLKASVIHDLFEDTDTTPDEIRGIDNQANQVVDLVLEVTRPKGMLKTTYLKRILEQGSTNAKILKAADRISNLTDLHRDQYERKEMCEYLDQTEKFVLPMAEQVNKNMAIELRDLINLRRKQMRILNSPGLLQL